MKGKRVLSLFIVLALVVTVFAGCSSGKPAASSAKSQFKDGMVTDVGGINDQSFNQGAWNGLQAFGKANPAFRLLAQSKPVCKQQLQPRLGYRLPDGRCRNCVCKSLPECQLRDS
jgi:hypothetical protein